MTLEDMEDLLYVWAPSFPSPLSQEDEGPQRVTFSPLGGGPMYVEQEQGCLV